jgi:DNA-binding transcriptional LysR family regulator
MSEPLVELRLWRQFVAVAEELHFGRAAARLHMTQPPLTQAIAQLERLLGVRLFERTKRSVRADRRPARRCCRRRASCWRARRPAGAGRAAAGGAIGRLRMAFVSTVGFRAAARVAARLSRAQPQVQLELIEATGDVQLRGAARGDIDAGFMLHSPGFAPPGLEHLRGRARAAGAGAARGASAGDQQCAAAAACWPEPLVIFPRRIVPSLHDALLGMYHAAGREPRIAQEAIQMQTIVNLVSAGMGVAWVPESVRAVPAQRRGVPRSWAASRRAQRAGVRDHAGVGRTRTPVLARFVAFVRELHERRLCAAPALAAQWRRCKVRAGTGPQYPRPRLRHNSRPC